MSHNVSTVYRTLMCGISGRDTKAQFHTLKYYMDVKQLFIRSATEMSFGNVFWFSPIPCSL